MKREIDRLEEQRRKTSQKMTEVDNVEKYIQLLKENQLCTDAFLIQKKKKKKTVLIVNISCNSFQVKESQE